MSAIDLITMDESAIGAILAAVAVHQPATARQLASTFPVPELTLLDSGDNYSRVCAVQMLASVLIDRDGDVRSATRLLRGLVDIVESWPESGPVWTVTIQTLITAYAGRAVDAGEGPDVHRNAPRWLALLHRLGNLDHVADLRLKQVEALINDGYYEEAREAFDLVPTGGLRGDLVAIRGRLYVKLDNLLKRPDESLAPLNPQAVLRATLDYLQSAAPAAKLTRLLEGRSLVDIDQGDFALPAFPAVPRSLEALDAASERLADARAPLMALQAVLQGAGEALGKSANDVGTVAVLLRAADRAVAAADALGYWEASIDASWIGCVALRRAGQHGEALKRMLALAARIEERRRLIAEPRLRAGIAICLPHLPWAIAESAARVHNTGAGLFGMEVSKARILGDLRLGPTATTVSVQQLTDGLTERLIAHPRTHLLTFLVDTGADIAAAGETGIRALLRTADGQVFGVEILLGEAAIRAVAEELDKLVRGIGQSDFMSIFINNPWRRPFEPLLESIAPLVRWIEPLLVEGAVRRGDTIVYAADGSIHNIPLAMLPFAGATLIDSFALVAMPSLLLGLAASPAPRPNKALAVLAPTPAERARGESYAGEIDRIKALLPTTEITAIEDVPTTPAAGLVHISAHGTFARDAPLRSGGVVIAGRDGAYSSNESKFVLKPEQLADLAFDGVHLTLRACMVGRVMQITSREALGAVWGVLAAGAATLAAASWTVWIPSAARWCDYFYKAWLHEGMSRAGAHRAACIALRDEGGEFAHPAHWAPIVLYAGTFEGDVL